MTALLDPETPFGRRAEQRLRTETIAWLVTVRPDGQPVPVPVWFLWDGRDIVVYSQSGRGKLRNLAANPRFALHLQADPHGDDVVVVRGSAAIDRSLPPADRNAAYLAKYRDRIAEQWTNESFAADYSVPLRLHPDAILGF